ncbi:MAG: hypothetical protein QM725_02120 [Lacibacter sp.]
MQKYIILPLVFFLFTAVSSAQPKPKQTPTPSQTGLEKKMKEAQMQMDKFTPEQKKNDGAVGN